MGTGHVDGGYRPRMEVRERPLPLYFHRSESFPSRSGFAIRASKQMLLVVFLLRRLPYSRRQLICSYSAVVGLESIVLTPSTISFATALLTGEFL